MMKISTLLEKLLSANNTVNDTSNTTGCTTIYKSVHTNDAPHSAASFSFIPVPLLAGGSQGLADNYQPSTMNQQLTTPSPNKSFMSTLLRKSKFVAVLIAGLFFHQSALPA